MGTIVRVSSSVDQFSVIAGARPVGADTTGTVESTTAFAAALTAGTGKTVFVPAGTYLVDTLTVPAATTLWLDERATLKLKTGTSRAVVQLTSAGSVLRGGTIDGNASAQTSSGGTPAVSVTADSCRVERVTVVNAKNYGIRVSSSQNRITDCTLSDIGENAIFLQPSATAISGNEVSGCHIDRTSSGSGIVEGGIKVHGNGAVVVSDTRIIGNRVILPASPTLDPPVCIETHTAAASVLVQGNILTGGTMGISFNSTTDAVASGNVILGPKLYGIEFAGCLNGSASGNSIDGQSVTTVGLEANSTSVGGTFTGNTVTGCSAAGIRTESGCAGFALTGNRVNVTANYAINCQNSARVAIGNNVLAGNSTAAKAVMLDTTYPATVAGNMIDGFTQDAVMLYATTAVTINDVYMSGNIVTNTPNRLISTQLSGSAVLGGTVAVEAPGNNYLDLLNGVRDLAGTGTPEAAVTAGIGSVFRRRNGAAATVLYVKESGTGNTGWVAK